MPTTSTYNFRYPLLTDAVNVPQDIENLASDVETTLSSKFRLTTLVTLAANQVIRSQFVSTDTQPAWRVFGDGKQEWGVGGTTVPDTNLYRQSGVGGLQTDGAFKAGGIVNVGSNIILYPSGNGIQLQNQPGGSHIFRNFATAGDAFPTYRITGDGTTEWGPGAATPKDTNLYRSAAGILKTDNKLEVNTFRVGSATTSGWVLTADALGNATWQAATAAGIITAQEEGTSLTSRSIVNFIGATVTAADDAANNRTNVTINAAPLASPTFTGIPAAPTAAVDTNTTQLATTAYVVGQGYAKLAGPTFTGTTTTASLVTTNLRVGTATTAGFVLTADASGNATWQASAGGGAGVVLAPTSSTQNVIQSTGNFQTLTLKAQAGQNVPLLQFQSSTGTNLGGIYSISGSNSLSSGLTLGSNTPITSAPVLGVVAINASSPTIGVQAAASQTGSFIELYNSAGAFNWGVDPSGAPKWGSGVIQTTVGVAGGASALPATPTKYFKVKDNAGTTYVVPAYNP